MFFNISQTRNYCQVQISWTKSPNQINFFANRLIYFCKKLLNQIKNCIKCKKFSNWIEWFQKKKNDKKNLRDHFWKVSDELLNRNWSVNRYCFNSVYFFFLMLMWDWSKKKILSWGGQQSSSMLTNRVIFLLLLLLSFLFVSPGHPSIHLQSIKPTKKNSFYPRYISPLFMHVLRESQTLHMWLNSH